MTDLIDRQQAINAVEELDWYHQNRNNEMVKGANSSEHQAWYKTDDVYKALDSLPSTQPEPTFEQIEEYCRKRCLVFITEELYDKLTHPAIIRCKDCKHGLMDDDGFIFCARLLKDTDKNGFCSWAERWTGGTE